MTLIEGGAKGKAFYPPYRLEWYGVRPTTGLDDKMVLHEVKVRLSFEVPM
jgi:hypothetical protein